MNTERDRSTGRLLANDTLNVNDVLETVDRGDLSLTSLVGTTDNSDLVILSDWNGTNLNMNVRIVSALSCIVQLTLYFSRSSLERGALIIVRRTDDGALK